MAVSALTCPLLSSAYVTPSLLEAKVMPEALCATLFVKSHDTLELLATRKAKKLARKLAPLVVHNALMTKWERVVSKDALKAVLVSAEKTLGHVAGSPWCHAFRRAGELNIPPSGHIKGMTLAEKKQLQVGRKEWAKAGESLEEVIATWMVAHPADVKALLPIKKEAANGAISLKKMYKLVPQGF